MGLISIEAVDAQTAPTSALRLSYVRRGRYLSYATLGLVSLEAGLSLVAAGPAGSVALLAYGMDSLIEFVSSAAALWRLGHDSDLSRRVLADRISHRVIGACFLLLAVYVAADAVSGLARHAEPKASALGIAVAVASLVTMPLLARAKRNVARGLASSALAADAAQTSLCAYLSAILLGGLLLNAVAGWWWADPAASLLMVPIITSEGLAGVRGNSACADGCCAP
jgi:divalent metal cation (Fe/Co/Zn/Cd) transporter